MIIAHFTEKQIWEEEKQTNSIGAAAIQGHGFMPCFKIADLKEIPLSLSTLKNFIILCIDTSKITSEITYEKYGETNFEEPNIQGTIPADAVIDVLPYTFNDEEKFVATPALLNYDLIGVACEKLNVPYESHHSFNDGTGSTIILLNDKYIIKKAEPEILKANATFAEFYKSVPMLQRVVYAEENYEFVIFDYIPGDIMHTVIHFEDLTSNLKKITNNYKEYSFEGFGYIHAPVDTWEDFLRQEVESAKKVFNGADYLLPQVEEAITELSKSQFDKKLIHGDLGTHNFIAVNDKFVAAIDPIPVVGDVTYDLLYALVSNLDLLSFLSLDFLVSYTGEQRTKVIAMLKVVLYCRICHSITYDKDWIEPYLEFWDKIF